MTISDINFLIKLQKELNTQDTLNQSDPKYWVIASSIFQDSPACCGDYYSIVHNCGIVVPRKKTKEELIPELIEYLNEMYNEDKLRFAYAKEIYTFAIFDSNDREELDIEFPPVSLTTIIEPDSFEEFLLQVSELTKSNISLSEEAEKLVIYPDAVYLTQIDAEKHPKENSSHFDAKAHTYANTALGSPRYECLIKLLQTTNFQKLK
ncbi:hypothetical protein [Lactococcus fujiensis]|uniref:Uncharacterized protein n=1 Tax=Lactococcus fujiensis JCM 16395 TaxID=1291764 RepID=A0A2A5RID7_9LACT|nr:hypothetical protein [Lactococcus fujiensis]PCR98881.1 hypothetical protein RT41_GL000620 [Lactococcus fujiensis JCM 16395]